MGLSPFLISHMHTTYFLHVLCQSDYIQKCLDSYAYGDQSGHK